WQPWSKATDGAPAKVSPLIAPLMVLPTAVQVRLSRDHPRGARASQIWFTPLGVLVLRMARASRGWLGRLLEVARAGETRLASSHTSGEAANGTSNSSLKKSAPSLPQP